MQFSALISIAILAGEVNLIDLYLRKAPPLTRLDRCLSRSQQRGKHANIHS